MACENCDYVDTIIPMDYTKSAFKYPNRKQFHNWKMIGIQASHDFVYGKITVDSSGHLMGIASGCKPVEEINQNNHIIGRGAWYLRAKSDDPVGKSATYGIMGHCQSPGVDSDVKMHIKPSAWDLEDDLNATPFYRNWGLYQGQLFCQCPYNPDWHMAIFIEETVTVDRNGDALPQPKKLIYMQYVPDVDCGKKCGPDLECMENCLAQNSQLPGRFYSWQHLGGGKRMTIKTCEALQIGGITPDPSNYVCLNANDSVFKQNDILGTTETFDKEGRLIEQGFAPLLPYHIPQGIIAKLTSLPACNHFEKLFKIKDLPDPPAQGDPVTDSHGGSTITGPTSYGGGGASNIIRCERAALRFAGYCESNVAWGNCGSQQGIVKRFHYNVYEEHFDRWDHAENGCYKIFDEIYDVPEVRFRIRILAHKKEILERYMKGGDELSQDTEFLRSTWMTKRYTTGGLSTGNPAKSNPKFAEGGGQPGKELKDANGVIIPEFISDAKGCRCKNPSDGDGAPFPIRPYSEFVYCPNNFTCEKSCYEITSGGVTYPSGGMTTSTNGSTSGGKYY